MSKTPDTRKGAQDFIQSARGALGRAMPRDKTEETGAAPDRRWNARGYVMAGLIAVLLLAGGLGTWSATAELAGAVISPGKLRVETQRQVVQHPDGGVVGEILVREGDLVKAGEVLLRLDGTALRAELAVLESQLYEIMARRGRLDAEQTGEEIAFDPELLEIAEERPEVEKLLEGQRKLFAAREETLGREFEMLGERRNQISEQIEGTEAQVRALTRQFELIEEELVGQRRLFEQGLAQAQRVLGLEREAARLEGERGELVARKAQLGAQVAELKMEQLQLETQRREEAITQLRDLGFRELELKERRIALRERLARLDIRAPRDGVVYEMSVFALQAVVRPADPILYVVPTDEKLVIDVEVDPIHIDEVFTGQEAVVRFSSLSSRTTPELKARLSRVSPDAHFEEQSGRSYYKAEALLAAEEIERLEGVELLAGMPVEVFIQTDSRTPIAYLLKPITDYFNRAWRET